MLKTADQSEKDSEDQSFCFSSEPEELSGSTLGPEIPEAVTMVERLIEVGDERRNTGGELT